MATQTAVSICRVCHAQCPVRVDIKDGIATRLNGIKDHPVYHGYACAKGRALPSYHTMPGRLLRSQKRQADGSFADIASDQLTVEIAERLTEIIEKHGPRAVAFYNGTHGYNNFLSTAFGFSFMEAIQSPMVFTSVTIDQPGKAVSGALHGIWLAGQASIETADCWMFIGANPVVSMLGPVNPAHALKRNQQRGMNLIVIDPRRSEVAKRADVFLQAKPGRDAMILAAMIQTIFSEGLANDEFLARHVSGVDALREICQSFAPEAVSEHCGVSANEIKAAARMYAAARRGVVAVGTGPNMSGNGNLVEYLSRVLMTVCGHWLQEGDEFENPGVLLHPPPPIADAVGPMPAWGFGEKLRVRGLCDTAAGLPTAALSDEILLEGEGQVRALIVVGGNPMLAWPDQLKTREALDSLDLLVCLDTMNSATAAVADYVVACKTHLELAGLSALQEACRAYIGWGYWSRYGHYVDAVIDPPSGADVIEEWEFFYDVARHMDRKLSIKPASWAFYPDRQAELAFIPLGKPQPTTEQLYEQLFVDSPIPLAEVKKHPEGQVFDGPAQFVVAPDEPSGQRLDAGNETMLAELAVLATSTYDDFPDFPYRLVSRRLPDIVNSSWRPNPVTLRRYAYNPAFMSPSDIEELGLTPGDEIEIRSARSAIKGIVESASDVRAGVISMSHCWGGAPGSEAEIGGNTGRLTANDELYDPHTGIPRMSAIPVAVRKSESA